MFYNKRKTIGLFIFNSLSEFQSKVCHGVSERAAELGYNVAVFTSYGDYGTNENYRKGELDIFNLPPYEQFAGIILAFDTFTIKNADQIVLKNIEENANCPVVSLRSRMEGVNNVVVNNHTSMEGIIRHLVEEHDVHDMVFMTGTEGHPDAEQRLECYKRMMADYGFPITERSYFYGDFWKKKGKEACDWFLEDGKYPEAIVCANDYMAAAVIDELFMRNINVPDDIIVTGYDGNESALIYSPSITTVVVDFKQMAIEAVNLIEKHQNDDSIEDVYVPTSVEKRESCGCVDVNHATTAFYRCMNHSKIVDRDNLEMQFSFMNVQFGQIDKIEDIHLIIKSYIYNIEGFQNYFICLRDDLEDEMPFLRGYTNQMVARVAIKDRVDMGKVSHTFNFSELIPEDGSSSEPMCYVFSPLHFLDQCYGYEAYNFLEHKDCGNLYIRWSLAIDNAIMNILVRNRMKAAINELENMYIQDVLTGLYNRRGFEKYGRMQFIKARAQDKLICVIGIDMDGLKPINDIYGHHEGDSALRSVGYAIQEAACSGQIGARIGGDEFEVIFPCNSEDDALRWVETFENSLEKYNVKSLKPYKVYASHGYKLGIPDAGDTLESYMKESDDIMYRNKVINKTKRNESLR